MFSFAANPESQNRNQNGAHSVISEVKSHKYSAEILKKISENDNLSDFTLVAGKDGQR